MKVQKVKTSNFSEFAREIQVNKSLISKINDESTPVTIQLIALIKYRYPDINGNWLETGDGSMYETQIAKEPKVEYFNRESILYNYPELVKKVTELDDAIEEIKKILNLKK